MKALPFRPEQKLGNAVVIELLTHPDDATTQEEMWYRVRYMCCGQIGATTHRKLWDRERRIQTQQRPLKNCSMCAPSRDRRRKAIQTEPPIDGLYDLRGQWWPFLRGPMGPRWGTQHPLVRGNEP